MARLAARLDDLRAKCSADAELAAEVFPAPQRARFLERMGARMMSERVQARAII